MSVMTLIGLDRDKSAILNAIQRTAAAQICESYSFAESEDCSSVDTEGFTLRAQRAEKTIRTVSDAVEQLPKDKRAPVIKDGFGISKDEFLSFSEKIAKTEEIISAIEKAQSEREKIKTEIASLRAAIESYAQFSGVDKPFDFFKPTASTEVYLGTIDQTKQALFESLIAEKNIFAETFPPRGKSLPVALVFLKRDTDAVEEILAQAAFTRCRYKGDFTAAQKVEELSGRIDSLKADDGEKLNEIAGFAQAVKDLKIYSDYACFCKEKAEAEGKFKRTRKSFILQAYVPTEAVEGVQTVLKNTEKAVFTQFESVPRNEFAPTLEKNGKIVSNFEVVTDMYSSPAYGALDPNAVMSFFFSLFMGVIMADVGYGLLMAVGGFLFAKTARKGTSLNRMAKVFAYGGFFAIAFGALFDSWLGFPLLRNVLGEGYNAFYAAHLDQINSYTSVAGINVPAILMWCLALGTAQIAVGLILNALQCFRRGKIFLLFRFWTRRILTQRTYG